MPNQRLASLSLAEFEQQFCQGRVEPELGPPFAARKVDAAVRPDASRAAADISGVFPEIDNTPQPFGFAPREAPSTSAPSRRDRTERPHVGSAFYLLLVGLIAAATTGVFFGIAFFLLAQPKDRTFVGGAGVSSGMEEPLNTARDTTRAGDAPTPIVPSAETAPAPDPASGSPSPLAPPPGSPDPAATELVAPPDEPIRSGSAVSRSIAHSPPRLGRSAHHHRQPTRGEPAAQAQKQRLLSAAMGRAHHENFSDPAPSLTPPQAGAKNPFNELITQLTGRTTPARSLTPPRAEDPDPSAQGVRSK
jgi:hypothetical protein